jgi:polyhydroxyalkanoate synthesis regulator phasin
MTKFPVSPGILLLLILTTITARGADDLFAPEPVSPASPASPSAASQVSQPSLTADMAAMAEAAAAVSTVPPISVNPVNSTNSDSSTLLEQNQTPAPTPNPSPATAAPSVSTQEATPIKDSQLKDSQIKDVQPVGRKSQAAPLSLPIDQPPNLDQPADKMAASAPPPTAPSENVTLNLINRLVQRGILTKEDAGDLIRQAKEDAQRASQQSQVAQQAATQAATAQQMAMEAAAPPSSDDAVSVSYVPEIVKSEMRDEIKRDVIAAAQSEGWATPNYP